MSAGVDWAGGHWLAVTLDSKSGVDCVLESDFSTLIDEIGECDPILVDVPIGLPSDASSLEKRETLDSNARKYTGRPSSVFPVPAREAANDAFEKEDPEYEDIVEKNEEAVQKGLNQQSFYIADGIGEVDSYLQQETDREETILESHPEVCFRAFKGEELQYSKTTAPGVGERLAALGNVDIDPGNIFYDVITNLPEEQGAEVTVDDALDAIVLGVTAQEPEEFSYITPQDKKTQSEEDIPTDDEGLPMKMVYRDLSEN